MEHNAEEQEQNRDAFEAFLKQRTLKLTSQRERIFVRVFATHEHFSAETLYNWLREEEGARVSRATVYRTVSLLEEGGFLEALDTGGGEMLYEHVLGHHHHDHLVCIDCRKIEEFVDEEIEALQEKAARSKGFTLVSHNLRLFGLCADCAKKREADGGGELDQGLIPRATSTVRRTNAN